MRLVVDAAERGVVDDALGSGEEWDESFHRFDGDGGFAALVGDGGDVEDDPVAELVAAGGHDHPLGSPRELAGALEVEVGVGLGSHGSELAGGLVELRVAGAGLEQRGDDLAVAVDQPGAVRVRPRPFAVGVEDPDLERLGGGEVPVDLVETGQHVGIGQVRVPVVEIVVSPHRLHPDVHPAVGPEPVADHPPHRGVRDLRLDLSSRSVDRDERFEQHSHALADSRGVDRRRSGRYSGIGFRQGVQLGVGQDDLDPSKRARSSCPLSGHETPRPSRSR